MQIEQNISLKPYNTFGIDATASFFTEATSEVELKEVLAWAAKREMPSLILGGGSNVLFTKDFEGILIKNSIPGIEKIREDDTHVFFKVGAGVVWHDFVMFCVNNNLAGVENLALIPGFVGASPMQNIGAYGVEIKEVFEELNALHKFDLRSETFNNADCEFGYRESIFKNKLKDQYVITQVTYRLNKIPNLNTEYAALRQELEKNNVQELSIRTVADAVIRIRSSKLPDPKQIGNAGSFFKNPSVSHEQFERLQKEFPNIVAYPNDDGTMKLAAAWMIEQCSLKGTKRGQAGVHEKQALVLVNLGKAKGEEILALCHQIKDAVLNKFGVAISPEVNII